MSRQVKATPPKPESVLKALKKRRVSLNPFKACPVLDSSRRLRLKA
jgi:hypothetical protein